MLPWPKNIIIVLLLIPGTLPSASQVLSFKGMAAGQATAGYSNQWAGQVGGMYIPSLEFSRPAGERLSLEGEFSANLLGSYTSPTSGENLYGRIKPYRMWIKVSGDQFEVRGGLQKINFGSAAMLRPLMWFDRIDPSDPLQLTEGVYGLLGRYYTLNNLNLWGWVLYGNKGTKGWEILETAKRVPEFGARLQLPLPATELAFTYHQRRVFNDPSVALPQPGAGEIFTERRVAFDIRTNVIIGLWLEAVSEKNNSLYLPKYTNKLTLGADYTVGIGNGLNIMAEHFTYALGEQMSETKAEANFTAATLSYPVNITTRLSGILYYDWKSEEFYRFINIGLTYDRFSYYLMGFWNPETFRIFDFDRGPSLFNGKGVQFMIVYNH